MEKVAGSSPAVPTISPPYEGEEKRSQGAEPLAKWKGIDKVLVI